MIPDARKMSEMIRMKKKALMESNPEIVDTDSKPDMNPLDTYDMDNKARIEETLDVPHKINADDTMMDETYHGVGSSPEEKARMSRLRMYFDKMDL